MTLGEKRFLCFQGKLPAAWLNALPCQSLGLKLTNSQLRISVGLRLVTPLCVEHVCVCGKSVDRSGWHGLSFSRSAGRFARHSMLNKIIKDSLGTLQIPSILEPHIFVPYVWLFYRINFFFNLSLFKKHGLYTADGISRRLAQKWSAKLSH